MSLEYLLFAALSSDFGIEVSTSDSTLLRAKLYPLKKRDPTFESLSFIIPPTSPSTSLWIIKKE